MSPDFDVTRATAIIKRAIEADMPQGTVMPESDADKIIEAERIVALARQVEPVYQLWVEKEGPIKALEIVSHWPAVEAILMEANVFVGANEDDAQSNGHAQQELPNAPSNTADDPSTTEGGDANERADSISQGRGLLDATQPQAVVASGAQDPQEGEVWADERGQEWEVVKPGQVMVLVRLVATGEQAEVPAGFLKKRVRGAEKTSPAAAVLQEDHEQEPEVIDDFSGEYEFLSNFSPSPITIEGITYPTVEHAYQAAKTHDDGARVEIASASSPGLAKKAGRSLQLRPDWEDVKVDVMRYCLVQKFEADSDLAQRLLDTGDARLVEGNTWGDNFWGVPRGSTGENWLGKLLEERREELIKETSKGGTVTISGPGGTTEPIAYDAPAEEFAKGFQEVSGLPDTSIPEHDHEGDERYRQILDETAERYAPVGMPIPHHVEDPPEMVDMECLDQVPDIQLQRLHSKFNAVAARAKYLHDVEDARARGCRRARKILLREPMRQAKSELGKSSTIAERTLWAEEIVPEAVVWEERSERHSDEASAWETLFDIYAENVVVLSRDLTMRDKQRQS